MLKLRWLSLFFLMSCTVLSVQAQDEREMPDAEIGSEPADTDYVYLLNQDAWVMPETFERLMTLSKQYPEYGVLSPFQMNADMMHIDRNFVVYVMSWDSNSDITNDLFNHNLKDIYPVSEIMAAHWFMTKECILKVGGFSPSFPHYNEDGNYADRMHFWGLKLGVIPSLRVVHDRGWREDTDKKKMHLQYTSSIRLMSNPDSSKSDSFLKIIFKEVANVITYKSLLPLSYLWKLIIQKCAIEKYKLISVSGTCAFLKH